MPPINPSGQLAMSALASLDYDCLDGTPVWVSSANLLERSRYFLHHLVERNAALFDKE